MDLEQKIKSYQPTDDAVALVRNTKIVLLVGITGAGKDTLKWQLLQKPEFRDIVSHTTRLPRTNNGKPEVPDKDYHFIDLATAEKMVDAHEFIEVKYVHGGTVYGTSVNEVKESQANGKIALTDIDVQGVDEYKILSPDTVAIFILPPSFEVWRERLAKRYGSEAELEAEWPARSASAIAELTHALEVPYYHFIINDELARTVRVATEIAMQPDLFNRKDDEARLAARDLLAEIKNRL